MSGRTSIEWATHVWNPTRGCSRVSPGCQNCYAERVAALRLSYGPKVDGGQVIIREAGPYRGLAEVTSKGPRWTGKVVLVPEALEDPLHWSPKKPRRVFVNSMSDLFHEAIPFDTIAAIFGVMAAAPAHTFLVLTKRADRMLEWFRWVFDQDAGLDGMHGRLHCIASALAAEVKAGRDGGPNSLHRKHCADPAGPWPLPNVWIGVSVEDQARADERIPPLLQVPAAVRFLSVEPLLEPVDLLTAPSLLDWLIVGGESGPAARPCELAWIRSAVAQCRKGKTPVFVKQLGAHPTNGYVCEPDCRHGRAFHACGSVKDPKGGDPDEWPEDLRIREFPRARPAAVGGTL